MGQLAGDRDEVADAGRPDVYGGEAPHLRLVLHDLGRAQLPHRDPVLPAALHEGVQAGQLGAVGRDDQLAGDGMRDAVLGAELDHLGGAPHGVARLEGAGAVVDAAVDDAAVAAGLMPGGARFLLQHRDTCARCGAGDRVRRRQTDDPAADHQHVTVVCEPHEHHLPPR